MLHIGDLRAGYGGGTVLHGIDLSIAAGAVHVVVGHNGAGKTTLLHTVMGLHPAASGRLILDGHDISRWPTHRRARAGIGLVPQGRRVFATLTVREHLTLPRRAGDGGCWPVDRIATLFPPLGRRLGHRGGQLSGGEQQMLAIARALVTQPRLLLVDEPTEGLAPQLAGQVRDVIKVLAADGIGVLLTTPNLPLALAVADRLLVLAAGHLVTDLAGEAARADPAPVVDALTPRPPGHHAAPEAADAVAAGRTPRLDAGAGPPVAPPPPTGGIRP